MWSLSQARASCPCPVEWFRVSPVFYPAVLYGEGIDMLRKVSLGLIVALAACGSARVIQRNQSGGVIELSGDRGKAMEQANQEMASHCGPNNFTIVQEGEEAIGTDTFSQEN